MDRNWRFRLGEVQGAEAVDFDDSAWRVVDMPHDWSIEGPFSRDAATGGGGGYLPTGIGWYRKHFKLPPDVKGRCVWVEFDGIYEDSTVWVNGHEVLSPLVEICHRGNPTRPVALSGDKIAADGSSTTLASLEGLDVFGYNYLGGWNPYARPPVNATTADLHLAWDVRYIPGVLSAVGKQAGGASSASITATRGTMIRFRRGNGARSTACAWPSCNRIANPVRFV